MDEVTEQVLQFASVNKDDPWMPRRLFRILGTWRAQELVKAIVARHGTRVQSGPFAGMEFYPGGEGGVAPRLLGCYEAELHAHVEDLIAEGFQSVLNIGCAQGYYAVGLAMRIVAAQIYAYDTDLQSRRICETLSRSNAVQDRVHVRGEFLKSDFSAHRSSKTLVVCDIEGGEFGLLDPLEASDLADMTILVECHEGARRGLTAIIQERFAATHRILRIDHLISQAILPDWMRDLDELDRLMAVWEWRQAPTPWLLMRPTGGIYASAVA